MANLKELVEGFLIGLMVGCVVFIIMVAVNPKFLHKTPKRLNPIVRLTENGQTFCSGTVITENTILTAAHCVTIQSPFGTFINAAPIDIRAEDNMPLHVYGKTYYATGQMDQALLHGDFRQFEPKKFVSDPTELTKLKKQGKRFKSCGYPLGGNLYCSEITYEQPYGLMFSGPGTLIPGMSGGPTMTSDGSVVAVNCAVIDTLSVVSPIYNIDFNFRNFEGDVK